MTSSIPPVQLHTVLVHDRFQGYFGAERVVEAIRAGLFAEDNQPDIITFYAAREHLPPEIVARIRQESRLTRLPGMGSAGGWKYLLPLMPRFFRNLRLDGYELVLSHRTRLRCTSAHPPACSTSATATRPFATRGSLRSRETASGESPASGCVGSGRTSGASTCAQRRTRTASWPIRRPFKSGSGVSTAGTRSSSTRRSTSTSSRPLPASGRSSCG